MTNFENSNQLLVSNASLDTKALLSAFSCLQSEDELLRFLSDLCTPAELRALAARWQVAKLLNEGKLSYRDIAKKTGASTTTVGRVARFLNEEAYQGYNIALSREKGQ